MADCQIIVRVGLRKALPSSCANPCSSGLASGRSSATAAGHERAGTDKAVSYPLAVPTAGAYRRPEGSAKIAPEAGRPGSVVVARTVSVVSDSVGDMNQQCAEDSCSSDQDSATAIIHEGLPVVAFATRAELRDWLHLEHARSSGIWVRLARSGTALRSISFHDLLEEGLCFGWSESTRHRGDAQTFLQKFTPRRTRGTKSARNRRMFEALDAQGLMTAAGAAAMGTS